MKNQQNQIAKHIFLTGSFIAGSVLGFGAATTTNAENLFGFRNLGSGADLRTSLLESSSSKTLELKCGGKTKTSETKSADAKCGNKPEKTTKASETKSKDAKCGEGKCGSDKKVDTKKADMKKAESKTKDAKCGEGKCGGNKAAKKDSTTPTKK
ncbi:MAG: hypothetical protein WCS69_11490 [Ignavibacteriaceae bacterium]|jgi:uncharacterized low-complexity protein